MAETVPSSTRNLLAYIVIGICGVLLVLMVFNWFYCEDCTQNSEKLFGILLPVISTWIGTLLAFYFGKENFEAASKTYEKIISKLTPDVLDDVKVKQVMTDRASMVVLNTNDEKLQPINLPGLLAFLDSISKARLPILDPEGKIKFIIHKSIITELIAKPEMAAAVTTMEQFVQKYPIIAQFGTVKESDKIEVAQQLIKDKKYSDIFVTDANNVVIGWLTDVQIVRYLTC
ncbi:MAG: CBS domain-containing protein [Flavobacterium sp.]|nr:CBS domain-containing protein [Flavobacterium sp.]